MRTREGIEEQLSQFDFQVHSYGRNGETKYIQAIDSDGINVIVDESKEETFELVYMVPRSIIKVTTGKCSPFHMRDHFVKMLTQMRSIVNDLSYRKDIG